MGGHGDGGMTHFYTTVLSEKLGDEGLINLRHTHVLKVNDKGLLTSVDWLVLDKKYFDKKDYENFAEPVARNNEECDANHKDEKVDVTFKKVSLEKCKEWCVIKGCTTLTYFKRS